MGKVYHPCMLLTKKRYVGYMYETPDQVNPIFDAKVRNSCARELLTEVKRTRVENGSELIVWVLVPLPDFGTSRRVLRLSVEIHATE